MPFTQCLRTQPPTVVGSFQRPVQAQSPEKHRVVGHHQQGPTVLPEHAFQGLPRSQVEVVVRFVEQ